MARSSGFRGVGLTFGSALTTNARGRVSFRDARGRYVKGPGGATFFDELGPRFLIGPLVTESAIRAILDIYRPMVEEWMKDNAPWQDVDTPHSYAGEARDGLTAEVRQTGLLELALYVYHTVDYGVWLEVRWGGKYAIILPTIEHWGSHLVRETEVFG